MANKTFENNIWRGKYAQINLNEIYGGADKAVKHLILFMLRTNLSVK